MEMKNQLSDIIAGVSNTYGTEFLDRITKMLNRAIDADYTFIAMVDKNKYESRTITLVARGENAPNMVYSLSDTPCANVADDSVCCYPTGVCATFPKDQLLVDMNIDAYIGTPLHNSKGEVMGLIVALFEREIKNHANAVTLFQIFSGRISAEIERHDYEQRLEVYNQELSVLVKERTTELELALTTLKNNQSRMLETEKMASVGILAAGIAHEINNPLNFIKAGIDSVEEYLEEHFKNHVENLSPLFKLIREGVNRSSAIVKGLNQFSRSIDVNDEKINIHDVIDNCLAMLGGQIRNYITVRKKYTYDPVVCLGNGGKLHQAFLNLLTNAIQAIENEGDIQISTESINGNLLIYIKDTGVGISEENMAKISTPFFTTKDPGKGTGLGLSITYKIITDHKGSIQIKSEINKGSEFIVSIPSAT